MVEERRKIEEVAEKWDCESSWLIQRPQRGDEVFFKEAGQRQQVEEEYEPHCQRTNIRNHSAVVKKILRTSTYDFGAITRYLPNNGIINYESLQKCWKSA